MKLLVFADVHDQISKVNKLRAQEHNVFDAIIFAGDIGGEIRDEFIEVTDSFKCPTYLVYGNWDNTYSYRRKRLSHYARLIHFDVFRIGDFYISGFSGSPTSWGKNPIYMKRLEQFRSKFSDTHDQLQQMKQSVKEIRECLSGDRYLENEEFLKTRNRFDTFLNSSRYRRYHKAYKAMYSEVLDVHRNQLVQLIRAKGISQEKLIVLTHERLYRLADYRISPLLCVFGHIHHHAITTYKGTTYLNTGPLDNFSWSECDSDDERDYCDGYCIVELLSKLKIKRKLLR